MHDPVVTKLLHTAVHTPYAIQTCNPEKETHCLGTCKSWQIQKEVEAAHKTAIKCAQSPDAEEGAAVQESEI